ncbi:MAG TPA: histidinol-phosphate transaminase [Bryobacteraceae bacterium]|nr:histidinol-phosphate transaminase [Bryobacteraceae bacterium]
MDHIQTFLDSLRPEIKNLPLYNAGVSSEYVRSNYKIQEVAKLGSNENSHGTSPKVLAAIASAVQDVSLYPDSFGNELREALAERLNVARDRLVLGNGSDDLIAVAVQTFLSAGDEVLTVAPSYGLHLIWPQSIGARIRAVAVQRDYTLDINEFIAALTPRTRMIMFSNPSNPVGTSITAGDMSRLLSAVDDNTLIVFDEAYFEYAAQDRSYPAFAKMLEERRGPWLLLRTFSKAYALAGLRIGYALASDAALIQLMDRVRGPFNVNRLALVAALAALEEREYVQQCISRTGEERERIRQALDALGYHPAPSSANFLFFDAHEDSFELAQRLLPHGVIVKPWREPGFTGHIRVSIGSPRANDQFLTALGKVRLSPIA